MYDLHSTCAYQRNVNCILSVGRMYRGLTTLHTDYLIYRVTDGNRTFLKWYHCDSQRCTLHSHAEHFLASTNENTSTQHAKCLFSTGWCHPTHCTIVNGRGSSHVSRKGHFTFRRHPMAPKVSWFDHLWLFFCGDTSNHMSILTNLAPCLIWRRQSGRKWQQLIVRDAGMCIRRFSMKAWKLHSRKWTPPAWHYLSFIICNSNGK